MNPQITQRLVRRTLLGFAAITSFASHAQTINFAQSPAGASAREPAPNIIVSVDDSGSMGWDINGCMTADFRRDVYGNLQDPTRPANAPACPSIAANPNPSRMSALRSAIVNTFGNGAGNTGIIPDDRIRLAWQAMWDNGRTARPAGQQNQQDVLNAGQINTIKPFSGAHRTNFNNFISTLSPVNGTPSHKMMANVRNYMSATGASGPFASDPGVTGSPYLSCRRSYHILMTDGAWNSETTGAGNLGNTDGTSGTLPDGTSYSTTSDQTRVYRDTWGGNKGTLGDWAFSNWATDFQSTLTNDVRALLNVRTDETVGATTLTPYWNPKNNPMTWQGVTQYTIGFGNSATTWTGAPTWNSALDDTFAGDYSRLVNGQVTWQNLLDGTQTQTTLEGRRASDLWHAALNGRGRYFPARTPQDLQDAFEDILNDILTQTARPLVSIATSSSRASAGNFAYVAGYDSAANWSGSLKAFAINPTTNLPATTPTWQAQVLLDNRDATAIANRVILTHDGTQGRGFRWNNLSSSQQMALRGSTSVPAGTGTERVDYLRGDRSLEASQPNGYMRNRSSRLGDIVNSNIWHLGKPTRQAFELPGHASFRSAQAQRTPTLYVGANDGMLHAFNAQNGQEMMAYVPLGLYGSETFSPLRTLTQTSYSHRYFVDGSPFTGDVNIAAYSGGVDWRTLLVGSLGAGGKGYFVLDVTNPSNFVDPGTGNSAIVRLDTTGTTDPNIGHIFATPVLNAVADSGQIVRVNDTRAGGRWAVILGNGYNSTNQRPALIVQYLDGDMRPQVIPVTASGATGQGNGLGAPRPIDLNGDGKMDLVYAGDLKGNLWKFDISSSNTSDWRVAFNGNPLFVARDSLGATQPITSAPYWDRGPNNLGGIQVLFGTGANLSGSDSASTQVQTVYSVWDNSTYSWTPTTVSGTDGTAITGPRSSALVEQTQTSASGNGRYFETSRNGVLYSRSNLSAARRGWFFDLPVSRERVLAHPGLFEGQVVLVNSVVPAAGASGETCDLSSSRGAGYLSVFNIYSGQPPKNDVFGVDNGNRVLFGSGELAAVYDIVSNRTQVFTPEATCAPGDNECYQCTPGVDCPQDQCTPGVNCPNDPPDVCGGIAGLAGRLCGAGLGGQGADWRELR